MLSFTDSLARDNAVSDEVYARLSEFFDSAQILKLSFAVSLAGMVNRVHATFRTDVDAATQRGAKDTPFPARGES